MGGCFGIDRRSDTSSFNSCVRKNHPLYREVINWRSDTPLSERELLSKRDEFWDTAPAFDGRREIWDALRAAANAFENEDFDLAQAILDGASITVPNGYLTESYDELGTRYQVPIYCLFKPMNLSAAPVATSAGTTAAIENEMNTVLNATVAASKAPLKAHGSKTHIKLRLSHTNRDIKLTIFSNDSILSCKQKLQNVEGIEVPKQRWFFGGKLLMDRMQIGSLKIPHNYIVQVVVDDFSEKKPLPQPLPVQTSATTTAPIANTATIIIETADTAIAAS